jgi:MFS family permease
MSRENNSNHYPSTSYAWMVLGILLTAYVISMVDRQVLSLMIQPIRHDLGITDVQVSLLHGFAFVLFYATFGLVFGKLADTVNRRNIIISGMVLWCLATAACGLARSFGELFAARMFVGVGEAALTPAAYSIIADYFPRERRARATTVYAMGVFLGAGLAMVLGGLAMAASSAAGEMTIPVFGVLHGWQAAFIIVGSPGLLVAALMLVVREPIRREKSAAGAGPRATLAFIRRNAAVLSLLYAAFCLNSMVNFGLLTWLPTFYVRNFGWTYGEVGSAYGLILLTCGSVGVVAGGWNADRLTRKNGKNGAIQTAIWSAMLLVPAAAAVGFSPSAVPSLIALGVATFLGVIPVGLTPVLLFQIAPNEFRGQASAVNTFCTSAIGMGTAPLAIASLTEGVFHDDHAVGYSIGIVATLAAAATLACLALARQAMNRNAPSIST